MFKGGGLWCKTKKNLMKSEAGYDHSRIHALRAKVLTDQQQRSLALELVEVATSLHTLCKTAWNRPQP